MHIVHVYIHVKPEYIESFIQATEENASQSIREPGIARFDFIRQSDDPYKFVLVEVYRTPEAALAHKVTPHYLKWKDSVAEMMAEPRSSVKYENIYPEDDEW